MAISLKKQTQTLNSEPTQPVQQVISLSDFDDASLIAELSGRLSCEGLPSEIVISNGYLSADETLRKKNAVTELSVKDSHFSSFTMLFGKLPVFRYTLMDGTICELNTIQLVNLLKSNSADFKDTLKNPYLIAGGIDFNYEPIGKSLSAENTDNSALRTEFKALLDVWSTDEFKADIVKNGRKPDQFRVNINHGILSELYPEKLRYHVMTVLIQHGLEFLEFIRDDDDKILTVVAKKLKD